MAESKADAPFVFEGSVKSLAASNVAAVPADNSTVIVQVEHVRHAPRSMAGMAGQEVTVKLAPGEKLAAGERGLFYADSLVFADEVAVQSLGHDPLAATEARAALAGAAPVVQRLRKRVDQAQAVVSGQVAEVRPARAPVKATAKTGATTSAEIISEHAPVWQEAVIRVSDVHKGPAQKKIVVRFPASTDVKWRKAPRFKKGQQGTWLLHAGAAQAGAPATRAAAPAAPEYYTALDPDDFHTGTEASVLQAMLPGAGPAPAVSARSAPKAKAVKKAAGAKKARRTKRGK